MNQNSVPAASSGRPIPDRAGVGLRLPHHGFVRAERPDAAWLEVHPENYLTPSLAEELAGFANDYPISLHAVGLSLGSAGGLDEDHLLRLKALERRVRPALMSDHLSWSVAATPTGPVALPDLLPLPYTEEALSVVIANVDHAQAVLGRRLLIENPSTYLCFTQSSLSEAAFLAELVRATGCGVLLDVNNLHVSAMNLGGDPALALQACLDLIPHDAIGEIHLAGHAVRALQDGRLLRIDDHGSRVSPQVWRLYETAIAALGPRPTLIEWDTDLPAFAVLLEEAALAQAVLDASSPACGGGGPPEGWWRGHASSARSEAFDSVFERSGAPANPLRQRRLNAPSGLPAASPASGGGRPGPSGGSHA